MTTVDGEPTGATGGLRSGATRRTVLAGAAGLGIAAVGGVTGRVRAATDGVYYVAPWGRDGADGTVQRPFRTLAPVAHGGRQEAPDGATIRFHRGTYDWDDSDPFSRQDGLTFEPFGGRVVIDGRSNEGDYTSSGMLQLFRCDDATVRDVEVRRAPGPGVRIVRSARPLVERVIAHHCGNAGVAYDEVTDGVVRGCEVSGNYSPDAPVDGGAADGVSYTGKGRGRSVGGVVEDSLIHHNSDDGIDLFRARGVTVRHNRVWANGYDESGEPIGEAAGKGIKLGSPRDRRTGGHLVHHNLAWFNGGAGIGWNGAELPVRLYNNTAFGNERKTDLKESIDGDDIECYGAHPDSRVVNNAALRVSSSIARVDRRRVRANAWQLGADRLADLGFADGRTDNAGNPVTEAFAALRRDSALLHAGEDVGLAFEGARPHVGARGLPESGEDVDGNDGSDG